MWQLYNERYVHRQRKAYHLEKLEPKFGWFLTPTPFSRRGSMLPMTSATDYERAYPSIYFTDPSDPGFVWVICIKILLGDSESWHVSFTRIRA